MKIRNYLTAVISLALTVIMLFSFASCNTAAGRFSEKNAYVSVYVYTGTSKDAKPKFSLDKLRVAPQDEVENPETDENGLYTAEAARQLYRTKPTGLYALELALREKDANAALPEVIVSQYDGTVEYTLETILGVSSGKSMSSNDMFEWRFYINGAEADPVNTELHTYDLLEFRLIEQTYRTFTATFKAMYGAQTLFEDQKFSYIGEKADMTISYFLQGEYEDLEEKKTIDIDKTLGLVLSDDGKRVVKIGNLEEDETHKWRCLIDEEEIDGNLTEVMINERYEIVFEYYEIPTEPETGEITEEIPQE